MIFSEKLSIDNSGHGPEFESYFMAFVANKSRLKAKSIQIDEFRTKLFKSKNTNF